MKNIFLRGLVIPLSVLVSCMALGQTPSLTPMPIKNTKPISKTNGPKTPSPLNFSTDDEDFDSNKAAEAQAIIDDIKLQNPPDTLKLKVMMGVMELVTSSVEAVGLGSGNTTAAIGLDGVMHLFGNFGLEAREVYSQNLLPTSTSLNQTSAYMSWFDIGPRYTFFLDSTHLDDNVVFKILYHENYNNLVLNSPTALFVNYYSGVAASFERNIPITNKLGIMGMFDLLQIFNTSSPSVNTFQGSTPTLNSIAKSGYGFEIQAEVYYKFIFDHHPARIGFAYWQQGNQSELDDSLKTNLGQQSYFQVTRALFGTMSVLF